ncbi:MAG: hypothetical protein ACFFED_17335, partial [Candidatus Thorarchaeota archaeon]
SKLGSVESDVKRVTNFLKFEVNALLLKLGGKQQLDFLDNFAIRTLDRFRLRQPGKLQILISQQRNSVDLTYHGLNEKRLYLYQDETITFRVYDGEIYSHEITIYASHYLDEGETLQIDIEVYLDDEMEYSNSLILIGPSAGGMVYGQVSIAVNPDSYKIDLDPAGLETISCIVAQPLADGMMPEILAWDSYMFLMLVGSFFLLLGGICVGKEERTRIRTEPYDQEPPRQGEVYTPRFKP